MQQTISPTPTPINLETLATQLQALREERLTLETLIFALSKEIIEKVGIDSRIQTKSFQISVKRIERIIFDRERFNEVFTPDLFSKVSKPSFANIIYLSQPKES